MQGLYNIAMALIPQIKWFAICYVVGMTYMNSPTQFTIAVNDWLKIEMKR